MRSKSQPDLHLSVEYPDLQAFLHDFRENICHGGTFITSHRDWVVGESLRMTLTFPGLLTPIRLSGIVAWARVGQDPGVGVDFQFHKKPNLLKRLETMVEAIQRSDPEVVAKVIRILIAEDRSLIFDTLQAGLNRLAQREITYSVVFECKLATDGVRALEIIENVPVDLLIADVDLPVLHGSTLIRECKDLLGPQFPVIAISGSESASKARATRAGADLVLPRPVRLAEIYQTIADLIGFTDGLL